MKIIHFPYETLNSFTTKFICSGDVTVKQCTVFGAAGSGFPSSEVPSHCERPVILKELRNDDFLYSYHHMPCAKTWISSSFGVYPCTSAIRNATSFLSRVTQEIQSVCSLRGQFDHVRGQYNLNVGLNPIWAAFGKSFPQVSESTKYKVLNSHIREW